MCCVWLYPVNIHLWKLLLLIIVMMIISIKIMLLQEQLQRRRQFVSDHMAYSTVYDECKLWCEDVAAVLEHCLAADSSVESKLNQLNKLSACCSDDGVACVERVRDAASVLLLSTSVSGGTTVNEAVSELVTYWEALVDKISLAHDQMEAELASCNEFDASLSKLLQQLHDAEGEHIQLSMLQSTLTEKVSYLERARVCFVLCAHFLH